jgi:hypothetical protein
MTRISLVRVWLPLVVVVVGTVLMCIGLFGGDDNWAEGGALIVSAGLSVWLLNVLHRVGVRGDHERDREQAARSYFDRHGRWPEEGADLDAPAPSPSPDHQDRPAPRHRTGPREDPHRRRPPRR